MEKKNLQENSNEQQKSSPNIPVNDENNPTRQERDERIGKEDDTKRVRSERESVQETDRSKGSNPI